MTVHFCFRCEMGTSHTTILGVPTCSTCQRRHDTRKPWGMLLVQYWIEVLIPARFGQAFVPALDDCPQVLFHEGDPKYVYLCPLERFYIAPEDDRTAPGLVWWAWTAQGSRFHLHDRARVYVGDIDPDSFGPPEPYNIADGPDRIWEEAEII